MPPLQVLVVDSDGQAALVVRPMLAASPLVAQIWEAPDLDGAVRLLGERKIDCAVVNLGRDPTGPQHLAMVGRLRAVPGHAPVVALAPTLSDAAHQALVSAGASDAIGHAVLNPNALSRSIRHAVLLHRASLDFFAAEQRLHERLDFERQLIGIVSHDLRNPVNAMVLAAASALRHLDRPEQVRAKLERIRLSGERAIKLIGDFLDLTQVHLGKGIPVSCHPTSLGRVAQEVVDELRQVHPARVIDVVISGDMRGELDADRMTQVLGNLLGNALAYGPKDSPITLTLVGEPEAFVITVHNGGEPIPPELLPALFEPLKRGTHRKNSGRSIDMGLFIVAQIVQAHDGTVTVESTAQSGTTFTVRIARARARQPAADGPLP